MHDRLQHLGHALAGLGAHRDRVGRVQTHGLLDGLLRAQDVGRGQVDLVDDGNDLQAVVDGQVGIGQRLRLHALAGVHHQQRALARGQRARDLVAEVHVARRVDQVELVGVAVLGLVHHAHGVRLDGDAALPLQVHIVQDLGLHLAPGHRAGQLQQPVAQRRLSVVDVGDNREVAKKACVHGGFRRGSREYCALAARPPRLALHGIAYHRHSAPGDLIGPRQAVFVCMRHPVESRTVSSGCAMLACSCWPAARPPSPPGAPASQPQATAPAAARGARRRPPLPAPPARPAAEQQRVRVAHPAGGSTPMPAARPTTAKASWPRPRPSSIAPST